MSFGKQFASNFMHDPSLRNLNHGASGTVCKPAFEAKMESLKKRVEFPDKYYWPLRRGLDLRYPERQAIANVLDADANNIVFCQGATTAFNAVVRSFPWKRGDKIVVMSTLFVNCRNTLEWVAARYELEIIVLPLQYPISDNDLVKQFTALIDESSPRMACFDVVSSTPSVYFPWEEMTRVCNERGVTSLVDGAHGIGLVPVSLRSVHPTFWFSNLHKWFWVTQSAAVLYVDPEYQKYTQSLPIAETSPSNASPERFLKSFAYASTLDYTVLDSLLAAAQFRAQFGEKAIIEYQTRLSEAACKMICAQWQTQEINPLARRQAMFTLATPVQPKEQDRDEFCSFVASRLLNKHHLVIPIFVYDSRVWVRFSATVYLELDDFEAGYQALEECFKAYKLA